MGLFRDLFGKSVTLRDLKTALLRVERERRKKQAEVRALADRQTGLIAEAKEARKGGSDLELDYLWEELSAVRADQGMLRREMRVLNLEGIGLKRYVRGLERLDREKNPRAAKALIERVRTSNLDAKLALSDLREKEYLDELNAILAEAGLDAEEAETTADPAKARFLSELDGILKAEGAGKPDEAVERTAALRSRLEHDAEKGEA